MHKYTCEIGAAVADDLDAVVMRPFLAASLRDIIRSKKAAGRPGSRGLQIRRPLALDPSKRTNFCARESRFAAI